MSSDVGVPDCLQVKLTHRETGYVVVLVTCYVLPCAENYGYTMQMVCQALQLRMAEECDADALYIMGHFNA